MPIEMSGSRGTYNMRQLMRRMNQRAKFAETNPEFYNKTSAGKHNELIAAAFLMSCGFEVYIPFSGRGVDLIGVDKDGERYGFEVRTSYDKDDRGGYYVKRCDRDFGRVDFYIGVINYSQCVVFDASGELICVHDTEWHTDGGKHV